MAPKKVRKMTPAAELFCEIQRSKPESQPNQPLPEIPMVTVPVKQESIPSDSEENASYSVSEEEPSLRKMLEDISKKVDDLAKELAACREESKTQNNRHIALLSQVNAKLDILGAQHSGHQQATTTPGPSVELKTITLKPVKYLHEMEALEQDAKNDKFVASVVESVGRIHGENRAVSDGGTVCLQIVDRFFDREFLTKCSWTGISRSKKDSDNVIAKISFQKFAKVINLFYQVVVYSDPLFTMKDCENFLHRCLRNAKQRFEEVKGTRTAKARSKCKRQLNAGDKNQDIRTEEEGEERAGEEEEEEVNEVGGLIEKQEETDENIQYEYLVDKNVVVTETVYYN